MTMLKWIAYYEDGHIVKQDEVSYSNLDRKGIREFWLMGECFSTTLEIKPDEVVFYRRRVFNATTPTEFVMYLLGARKKDSVRLKIIMPDLTVTEDTMFRNQWYEPQWLPQEQI